jgi:hypothetical protein
MYTTNEAGSVYKFLVKNTVEADNITYEHPFRSCDVSYNFVVEGGSASMADHVRACDPPSSITWSGSGDPLRNYGCDIALCDRLYDTNTYAGGDNNPPSHCVDGNPQFESSYAIWGGISHITTNSTFILNSEESTRVHVERQTENIICRLP